MNYKLVINKYIYITLMGFREELIPGLKHNLVWSVTKAKSNLHELLRRHD